MTPHKTNSAALRRLFPMCTLMLVVSVFFFISGTTALAAAPGAETLSVEDAWLTGDTLHIAVTDSINGDKQTLELNLSDYAKSGDEYVTVQATDSTGRVSNALQFKNPYYQPTSETKDSGTDGNNGTAPVATAQTDTNSPAESAIADGGNPFTPDGTGTVVDNATDGDGKEFFTVETPDGNVFYLIVDRERATDNVYLLNAVTEHDLASLAKPGNGMTQSAIQTPEPLPAATETPEPDPEPTTPVTPAKESGGNSGTLMFIVIAVLAVGGGGYYFKIIRPKQNGGDDSYDDEPEDYGDTDDEEYDLDDSGEDDE